MHKEPYELLREIFRDHGPKRMADALGVSLSLIYKWSENPAGSGSPNPLERIGDIVRVTRDPRLIQWLCQQGGGFFVRNAVRKGGGYQVTPAMNEIVQQFADLLAVLSQAAMDRIITDEESRDIRYVWERLKSFTEGFVHACEQGDFSSVPESAGIAAPTAAVAR